MRKDEKYQNFVAGLVAGFVSVSLCNPLDITRTRLNIMVNNIFYPRILQTTMAQNTIHFRRQCRQFTSNKA